MNIEFEKLPPQNLEAELCVLGSMLIDNGCIDDVLASVAWEDFYRDSHQVLFRAIAKLSKGGAAVDPIILIDALTRRDQFAKVGGDETIRQVLESPPHAANAVYYAQIVAQKACARRVLEASLQTLREVYSEAFTSDQLVESFERRAFALGDRRGAIEPRQIETLVAEEMRLFEERSSGGGGGGVMSGISELDVILGGFRPRLYILGARPGEGKSSLALNVADHVASKGEGALFFSLEMDDAELAQRFLAGRARINSKVIRVPAGALDSDRRKLYEAIPEVEGTPLWIVETASVTTSQIAGACRRHKARNGLSLVVVDYVQHIMPENRRESRQEQMACVSRDLMRLAKEIDVPILALAQLNREVEKREDRRPRMSDLRESGQFEADAHGIMLLYRPEDRPGMAELIVAKNRGGSTGGIDLRFDAATTTFSSESQSEHF
jgi:replicative DNA helicase